MTTARRTLLILAVALLFGVSVSAQSRVVVKFPRGSHSASAKGFITDYKYVDYILGARAGQTMTVKLSSDDDKAQLVVFDPQDINVEFGTGVGEYSGTLEKSGNYKVRVLLSRAEARRRPKVNFKVTFTIQ